MIDRAPPSVVCTWYSLSIFGNKSNLGKASTTDVSLTFPSLCGTTFLLLIDNCYGKTLPRCTCKKGSSYRGPHRAARFLHTEEGGYNDDEECIRRRRRIIKKEEEWRIDNENTTTQHTTTTTEGKKRRRIIVVVHFVYYEYNEVEGVKQSKSIRERRKKLKSTYLRSSVERTHFPTRTYNAERPSQFVWITMMQRTMSILLVGCNTTSWATRTS